MEALIFVMISSMTCDQVSAQDSEKPIIKYKDQTNPGNLIILDLPPCLELKRSALDIINFSNKALLKVNLSLQFSLK